MSNSNPIFFWGYKGNSSKKVLSNWYPCTFKSHSGITFSSVEQYIMYHKAILFNDFKMSKEIMECSDLKLIKQKGEMVRNFNQYIWEDNAKKIVYDGCLLKFSQNQELLNFLLSTEYRLLVQANPYDKIWGIGMDEIEASKTPQHKWKGKNWLGECLVQVRETLRYEDII